VQNRNFFAMAILAVVPVCACGSSNNGPKLIQADGVTYTACGGALWVPDETAPTSVDSKTYEVLFEDADGTKHQLQRVRNLRITDLPSDTPACTKSRQ
jgi:hypothetical protein